MANFSFKSSGTLRTVTRALAGSLVAGAIVACAGENHYEQLANDVTKAIVANDMRPVEPDFNAIVRPKLENRAYVGHLSDEVTALGALKSIKEDTPSGSPAGFHHFSVAFEKATWQEDLTLDSDGKIASFHVRPPASPS